MKTEILHLKSAISGLPREVQIIPLGRHDTERGAFILDEEGARSIVADFEARENDMVIDYEHQTLSGGEAPAAGWIKRLKFLGPKAPDPAKEARPGGPGVGARGPTALAGLWAVVEWTPKAAEYLKNREYRYLSPVFLKRLSDNRVMRLINAALTNQPAIDGMVPVVNKNVGANLRVRPEGQTQRSDPTRFKKEVRMQRLMELLGLARDATEEKAVEAVTAVRSETAALKDREKAVIDCLGLKEGATLPELRGTVMALKEGTALREKEQGILVALRDEVATLKAQAAKRDASELVAQAMKSGKVTPAQREWATKYAEEDPEGFGVFAAKAPVVVEMGEVAPLSPLALGGELEEIQLQVNRLLGVDEETYKKHNN